jgi:hypothetical protein
MLLLKYDNVEVCSKDSYGNEPIHHNLATPRVIIFNNSEANYQGSMNRFYDHHNADTVFLKYPGYLLAQVSSIRKGRYCQAVSK